MRQNLQNRELLNPILWVTSKPSALGILSDVLIVASSWAVMSSIVLLIKKVLHSSDGNVQTELSMVTGGGMVGVAYGAMFASAYRALGRPKVGILTMIFLILGGIGLGILFDAIWVKLPFSPLAKALGEGSFAGAAFGLAVALLRVRISHLSRRSQNASREPPDQDCL